MKNYGKDVVTQIKTTNLHDFGKQSQRALPAEYINILLGILAITTKPILS